MSTVDDGQESGEQQLTRTDIGSSIEATLKRGEGTRDEDRVKIKGKGETAEDALSEFKTLLEAYEEDLSSRLRDINPERAEDDEE